MQEICCCTVHCDALENENGYRRAENANIEKLLLLGLVCFEKTTPFIPKEYKAVLQEVKETQNHLPIVLGIIFMSVANSSIIVLLG